MQHRLSSCQQKARRWQIWTQGPDTTIRTPFQLRGDQNAETAAGVLKRGSKKVQQAVDHGKLNLSHAAKLVDLPSPIFSQKFLLAVRT